MAMQTLIGGFMLPPWLGPQNNNVPSRTVSVTIDAANEAGGVICRPPKAGNLRAIHWTTGQSAANATVDVRVETVDAATGLPTGTLFGTNTNGAQAVTTSDDNVIFRTQLTADAAVTPDDDLAVIVVNPGASFADLQLEGVDLYQHSFPYAVAKTGAGPTWAQQAGGTMAIALEYDDGSIEPIDGVHPPTTVINTSTINTGSTPDVVGARFRFPVSVRVRGVWAFLDGDGPSAFRLVSTAYNQGAGTGILATALTDPDVRRNTSPCTYVLPFDQKVTLSANTYYRLINEPTSGTSRTSYDFTTGSLALLDAWPGLGREFHFTTAKDPTGDGDWANFNAGTFRIPYMGLVIDGVDDASGATPGVMGARIFTGY